MKRTEIVKLVNVFKNYYADHVVTNVLKNVCLTVYKGDFVAITGRSGSGKSTLMNIIGLLDTPTEGTYFLNGRNTTKFNEDELAHLRNREIGFIFQSFNLLPRASALENVMLPAVYLGIGYKEREKRAKKLLEQFELGNNLNSKPNQLSGGQQQRVAIARALMNNPELVLADEPTGNLDTKSGKEVMNTLKKLNNLGKTIILITHEIDIAKGAKRVIHISDGKIIE